MSWGLVATARDLRAGDNPWRSSRQLVDLPSSLRCRPPLQSETALAEANSFPSGCQPFCCNQIGTFAVLFGYPGKWTGLRYRDRSDAERLHNVSKGSAGLNQLRARFDPANARQYPQTVARKSAIRLRPRILAHGDRAGQQQDHPRPTCWRSISGRTAQMFWAGYDLKRTRRTPWPRASGPSSRTTGAEPACTVSVCGCALALDVRSCPVGVARAAAHCLPDRSTGFCGAFRTQPHEAVD